jgi:hypothetical protein
MIKMTASSDKHACKQSLTQNHNPESKIGTQTLTRIRFKRALWVDIITTLQVSTFFKNHIPFYKCESLSVFLNTLNIITTSLI